MSFPYEQLPYSGNNSRCNCESKDSQLAPASDNAAAVSNAITGKEVSAPDFVLSAFPNPFTGNSTIKYRVTQTANVNISVYNVSGIQVASLVNSKQEPGTYSVQWNAGNAAHGVYFVKANINGNPSQSVRISKQ